MKIISSFAFYGSEIEKIVIPESVEIIKVDAFIGCSLKIIELNEGLREK